MADRPVLTTAAGAPIGDDQNSVTAGPRGPLLMQDDQLIEKLAHQNRERFPERTVHAKGWGPHGALTIGDISKYTKAKCLEPGAKTPDDRPLLDGCGRTGRRRRRARRARLRAEILHRGGRLGPHGRRLPGVMIVLYGITRIITELDRRETWTQS